MSCTPNVGNQLISTAFNHSTTWPVPMEVDNAVPESVIPWNMEDLPIELLIQIYANLGSAKDVISFSSTCRKINSIYELNPVWEPLCLNRDCLPNNYAIMPRSSGNQCIDHYIFAEKYSGAREFKIFNSVHPEKIACLLVDENRFFTGSLVDRTVKMWDRKSKKRLQTFQISKNQGSFDLLRLEVVKGHLFTAFKYTAPGKKASTRVKIFDLGSEKCLQQVELHAQSPEQFLGGNLYTSSGKAVRIWALQPPKLLQTHTTDHENQINCLCVDGKKGLLVTGSEDRSIKIWKTEPWECLRTLTGEEGMNVTDLQIHGDRLFALSSLFTEAGLLKTGVSVWDIKSGEHLQSFAHCLEPSEESSHWIECFHVDQHLLYTASSNGDVNIWGLRSGELVLTLNKQVLDPICIKTDRNQLFIGSKRDGVGILEQPGYQNLGDVSEPLLGETQNNP